MKGKRSWQRLMRVACAVALIAAYLPAVATPAYAATLYTGGADQNPPMFMLNDHTVYAVHFTAAGLPANTALNVTGKLSDTGVSGGFTNAPGFTWNGNNGTPRWVQQREAEASNGTMSTDASGNLSGYFYFKVGNENFVGFPAGNNHGANQAYLTVQIYNGASATYNPSVNPIVTVLDAKTQGAWAHNGVATGVSALQRADAVSTVATPVFSLQRTEANNCDDNDDGIIDNEDYGPAGSAGDFRFGLQPATAVNINLGGAAWAPGQGVVTGPADTEIAVGAADQTPPSAPTSLTAVGGNNKVTLNWAGSTDSGGSGLSGYSVFRKTGTQYPVQGTGDATNTTALPSMVGSVAAGVTTFVDNTAVNGTTYYYYVRATDVATNAGARSNEVSGLPLAPVPDVTPPTTSISGVAAGGFYAVPTIFSLSAVDNPGGSGVANTFYALDSVVNTYTAPVSIGTAGSHTVGFWSIDTSGNVEATKSVTFTSYFGPTTSISGVQAGWVNTSAPVFSLSATGDSPPIDSFYTLNGSASSTYTAPVTVSFQGTTTVNYWSVDSLARTEPTRTATIRYDSQKPVTSIVGIVNNGIYPNPVTFSLSAADNASGIQQSTYLIDSPGGAGGTRYTGPVTLTPLSAGTHTATYWSKDNAGNTESRKTTTFTVSAGPPVTTATGFPSTRTSSTVTFSLTATGDLPPIKSYYTINAGAVTTYTAPVPVSLQGTTTVAYLSVDSAGQREATKSASFYIDSVAPITVSDVSSVYLNSAIINLTPTDAGTGVDHTYYRLDGGPQVEGLVITTSTYGSHSIEFWSIDKIGNVESHRTANFFVDETVPPSTTSDAVSTYVGPAVIHLTATDNAGGSGVAATFFRVDGGSTAEGNTVVVNSLGTHTLEFWSVDVSGNEETPHHTVSFTVLSADNIAPVTTSDAVASYTGTATVHLTAADNAGGSGVAFTYYKLDGGVQTVGTTIVVTGAGAHSLEYWSVDVAGNTETHHTANFTITTGPRATSLSIRTNATSVTRGKSFILSGVVAPASLVGTNVQVMVKYPTKSYYSYSSLRTCYMNGAVPSWWYRYTAVKKQPAGVFKFYAFVPASANFKYSQSPVLNVTFK